MICVNAFEMVKNLPESMIKDANGQLLKGVVPIVYINKFRVHDSSLKNLCRKIFQYLSDIIQNLAICHSNDIFFVIREFLDSNSYEDRLSASLALQDLTSKLSEEDI